MITLSYSTIFMLYNSSHNWINKQMGRKQEERYYFTEGKEAHRIIQDHVSGLKPNPLLAHIEEQFPIVEQKDFDPKTKFEFSPQEGYTMVGWADGLNMKSARILEIKTSSTGWSIMKFKKSMQRKVYSIGFPWSKEAVLITCDRLPTYWERNKPKVMSLAQTEADKKEAMEWILGGIRILEAGNFSGGLINGKCTDPYCNYGINCFFK